MESLGSLVDILKKLKIVVIKQDLSHLTENQKKVIEILLQACDINRELYQFQLNPDNIDFLEKAKAREDIDFLKKNFIFNGCVNTFTNEIFADGFVNTYPFHSFYPNDITMEEWDENLKDNPQSKEDLISPVKVIVRNEEGKLESRAYADYYQKYTKKLSKLLDEAAEYADNFFLKTYLRAQSNAFLTDDYCEATIRWLQLEEDDIEPLFGPHEFYDDSFLGMKASFTSLLSIKDHEANIKIKELRAMGQQIQSILPIPDVYKKQVTEKNSSITVVNLLYSSGEGSNPIHAVAFNLPNSAKIRADFGSKKVFLKNIINAKFDTIMFEIGRNVLQESDIEKVTFSAYFNHLLLHEICHSLGINLIRDEQGELHEVSYFLKDLYSVIEETKSDIMGLYAQFYLIKQCVIIDSSFVESVYTYVVSVLRSLRFGVESAHGQSNLLQWNYLVDAGVIIVNPEDLAITVNLQKVEKAIESLLTIVLTFQAEGSYAKSKEFIEKFSFTNTVLSKIINGLEMTPIDILPVFTMGDSKNIWADLNV